MAQSAITVEIMDGQDAGEVRLLSGISILGRGTACTLRVQDRTVSREHVMIRGEDGVGFVIEDLDSRSGTFVNGVRTRKAVLLDGDVIRIGPVSMRVRTTSPVQGEVPVEEIQMVKSRHLPTTRLTLDAIKFRASARFLKDKQEEEKEGEPADVPEPAAPIHASDENDPLEGTRDPDQEAQEALSPTEKRLELLCEISNSLSAIHSPARLIRETAMRLFAMFPQARRIGFFQTEEDPDADDTLLRPTYLCDRSAREKGTAVQISHRVLHSAVERRRAILSEDVQLDPRFKISESLTHAGVCSIVCAPLCLGDRILGALYVDCVDPTRRFDEGALRLVTGVAAILASAFENARLFVRVQAESVRRASLERYFSPDLVERVMRGDLPLAREGRKTSGTILFVDIRGFTRITTVTDPPVMIATLNSYFAAMQRIIFRSRGTVERFGGDSILSYWGIVDEQDPYAPIHAVRAALAMQVEVFRLNPELKAADRPTIQVAVGLNTGEVVAGDVGSAERYEFTILGDAINMARRFEALAGAWEIVAGAATVAALGGLGLHQQLPPVQVKGKDAPQNVSLVHGLRVDGPVQTSGPRREQRFELAVPGTLDLGQGHEPTLASGARLHHTGALELEVLTSHDPEPEKRVQVSLRLPRAEQPCLVNGRVLPGTVEDTVMLTNLNVNAATGVQRVWLQIAEDAALTNYLRLA